MGKLFWPLFLVAYLYTIPANCGITSLLEGEGIDGDKTKRMQTKLRKIDNIAKICDYAMLLLFKDEGIRGKKRAEFAAKLKKSKAKLKQLVPLLEEHNALIEESEVWHKDVKAKNDCVNIPNTIAKNKSQIRENTTSLGKIVIEKMKIEQKGSLSESEGIALNSRKKLLFEQSEELEGENKTLVLELKQAEVNERTRQSRIATIRKSIIAIENQVAGFGGEHYRTWKEYRLNKKSSKKQAVADVAQRKLDYYYDLVTLAQAYKKGKKTVVSPSIDFMAGDITTGTVNTYVRKVFEQQDEQAKEEVKQKQEGLKAQVKGLQVLLNSNSSLETSLKPIIIALTTQIEELSSIGRGSPTKGRKKLHLNPEFFSINESAFHLVVHDFLPYAQAKAKKWKARVTEFETSTSGKVVSRVDSSQLLPNSPPRTAREIKFSSPTGTSSSSFTNDFLDEQY